MIVKIPGAREHGGERAGVRQAARERAARPEERVRERGGDWLHEEAAVRNEPAHHAMRRRRIGTRVDRSRAGGAPRTGEHVLREVLEIPAKGATRRPAPGLRAISTDQGVRTLQAVRERFRSPIKLITRCTQWSD